jgi:hypothetical protein
MEIISGSAGQQAQQYKAIGLSRTEYRSLFTLAEQIKSDKCRSKIDGDLSWLTGGAVGVDDNATALGFPTVKYRDLLRTGFQAYDDADPLNGFNITSQTLQFGLTVMDMVGLLDDATRKATILKGLPL